MTAARAARAETLGALVWVVLGAAIAIASWRMDRLESQGVAPFAAPGLVPGILGVIILVTGIGLLQRALRGRAPASDADAPTLVGALPSLAICLVFALGLVGHGLAFWLAAAIYLFIHILWLEFRDRRARGTLAAGVLRAALVAVGASLAIATVFETLFLVRLP